MLHTALDESGWYFAPNPDPDTKGRNCLVKRTGGQHQQITWPDVLDIKALWIHALHISMFRTLPAAYGHYVEGMFQPEWEIDPAMAFQEAVEHSRAMAES